MKNSTLTRKGCKALVRLAALLLFPFASFAQPANDLCANAIPLTSTGLTCNATAGTVVNATYTGPLTDCLGATPTYDVWYRFVAQAPNPTITVTIGATGSNISLAKIQLFQGACGGLISVSCSAVLPNPGSGSINATGLTVGNTYYVRVYSPNAVPTTNGAFSICVTYPITDACANAVLLTSGVTCSNTTGTVANATLDGGTGCPNTERYDVWYRFVAQTTNPTITLSNVGANFLGPLMEVRSGSCAGGSVQCAGTSPMTLTGLTINTTYYIRVYSVTNPTPTTNANFDICVTDPPPVNDLCVNASPLTSATTCVNTAGILTASSYTTIPSIGCGVASRNDVWYEFVAQTPNPTINLSSAPAGARLQLFSGSCGSLTSLACGTTSLTASGLTVNSSYYVRVYTDPDVSGTFNICIVDPPANDACTGAITLTSNNTCVNTAGTLVNSTYSTIPTIGCGVGSRNDVWYKFVAISTNPTITLTTALANPRIQIFSGSCGSLTSVACSVAGSLAATGLTLGSTYYVRVYTDPDVSGTFNICITDPAPSNDLCGSPTVITSSGTCNLTLGTLAGATYTNIGTLGCGATGSDVWYRFTAQTATPTITLSTTLAGARLQLFTACGTIVAGACVTGNVLNATGLTPGTQYLIRVYTNPNVIGTFGICVTEPANDECSGAISLTPAATCASPTAGSFYLATPSAAPLGACTGPVVYDLWYVFQATAANSNITLNVTGAGVTSPQLQLFSGSCGALTSIACGAAPTLAATGLIPGNYYYIRAYAAGGTAPANSAAGAFTICVTATPPAAPVPANDLCANAILLPVNLTCVKTLGTLAGATTASSTPTPTTPCGSAGTYDVWYRFVAESASTTINVGDYGINYPASGTRAIQLFSGTCGSLTLVTCISGTNNSIVAATGIGTTYYIRITAGTPPATFGEFSVCVYNTANAQRLGNSYVNLTKQTVGGVVEPGDILEIRMTVHHTTGTIYKPRYVDNVPTNTQMLTGSSDRLRVLTNEGAQFVAYTLGGGDDGGTYIASPPSPQYQIRMNLNFDNSMAPASSTAPADNTSTETASASGTLTNTNKPSLWGGAVIFATAFRVQVTGNIGDIITLNAPRFLYKTGSASGPDQTIVGTPYQILISAPMSLCANSTSTNMSEEFGGTFGTGATLNRSTDLDFPIPNYDYVNISSFQGLGDGQYAIVKNLSPRSGTNLNAERSPANFITPPNEASYKYRMHDGHWDVAGDHTGTTNATGNAPLAEGVGGGYMLMVNADYVPSETYRQTLNNLCPNTYYEFSAWFKNICPTCGNDPNSGSNWSPRQPGVLPNLTFALDGTDRYNTGEIGYNSVNGNNGSWVKKGFVFITGPAQTSAVFSIRNNSQGGGGNDWVMDDITVATCLPNMSYSPSLTPPVCLGNPLPVHDTIRSYFNNYVHYKWQKSIDGGNYWYDLNGQTGTGTPTLNGGLYEYVASYTVPVDSAQLSNDGNRYRVIVATSAANLGASSCNVTDGVSIISIDVIDCGVPLKTDLLSFSGKLVNQNGNLAWTTSKEEGAVSFSVERSFDGRNFTAIGQVNGYNNHAELNRYSFADPTTITDKAWYRIVLMTENGQKKYSSTILLRNTMPDFDFVKVVNPFSNSLNFDIAVGNNSQISIDLVDITGKIVRTSKQLVYSGVNSLNLPHTQSLTAGVYTLRVVNGDRVITKRVLKVN